MCFSFTFSNKCYNNIRFIKKCDLLVDRKLAGKVLELCEVVSLTSHLFYSFNNQT